MPNWLDSTLARRRITVGLARSAPTTHRSIGSTPERPTEHYARETRTYPLHSEDGDQVERQGTHTDREVVSLSRVRHVMIRA